MCEVEFIHVIVGLVVATNVDKGEEEAMKGEEDKAKEDERVEEDPTLPRPEIKSAKLLIQ